MQSNYKRLGDFIDFYDVRSIELEDNLDIDSIKGISSISKDFIKTKANLNGVVADKYKVVNKNCFAYNPNTARMGDKIPIALNTSEKIVLVSSIYPTFKIKNLEKLIPEYLMMWFKRNEFDRYARYKSHGSAREVFDIEEMNELVMPIPSIEKQQQVVREYNTIQNRIALNNQLITKLEETAQAIYKQWFVDFEFPDNNGKPYKSNGGKMNESELGDIPIGWEVTTLDDVTTRITDGSHTSPSSVIEGLPMASVKDMHAWGLNLTTSRKISKTDYEKLVIGDCKPLYGDILIAKDGSFLKYIFVVYEVAEVVILSSIAIIRPNDKFNSNQLSLYLKLESTKKRMTNVVNGGAIQRIVLKEFKKILVVVPNKTLQTKASLLIDPILKKCWIKSKENQKLEELKELMLGRMVKES